MSNYIPPNYTPPFPFKLMKKGENWRIIWNMKTDMLYLEVWKNNFWHSILDPNEAKKILSN